MPGLFKVRHQAFSTQNKINSSSFLLSAELSDVTIQYEDGLLPVHKIILAQASEYFKTLLTGPFAEAGMCYDLRTHAP